MIEYKIILIVLKAFFLNYIFWVFQLGSLLTLLYLNGDLINYFTKLKSWLTKN